MMNPMQMNPQLMAILAGLMGQQQTPQMSDPPIMGAGNPMASFSTNPMPVMNPQGPMQFNQMSGGMNTSRMNSPYLPQANRQQIPGMGRFGR